MYEHPVPAHTPRSVEVTVWWLDMPQQKYHSSLCWLASKPEAQQVRFRVVLTPFHRGVRRLHVDLVYPLTAVPGGLGDRDRKHLAIILRPLVAKALPDYQVAHWSDDVVDFEFRGKEEG